MAPLRCAAKFDPFFSLDCAPTPSNLGQSKQRKGLNFAIWQPCPSLSSFESRNYRHGQSRPKSAAAAAAFRPAYCDLDKKVLRFFAYFVEEIGGHAAAVRRVRHVHVMYFLEDDTISVIEPRIKVGMYWARK